MPLDDFETRLRDFRPRLHRYCARLLGSAVDGEDAVQDAIVKALVSHRDGATVANLEMWLLRIGHNCCIDMLRRRSNLTVVPLDDETAQAISSDPDGLAVGIRTFLRLPDLQRCAVILKDVLGHSVEEIAEVADTTPAAAKSALQRGRARLKALADSSEDVRLPTLSDDERAKMRDFVKKFQAGDFDAIRAMLAADVKLDLANRLKLEGRDTIGVYFTRYAQETKWRFAFGAVEGRPAMLVFDATGRQDRPAHFVLVEWRADQIAGIRDFLFAPYVGEEADWLLLR